MNNNYENRINELEKALEVSEKKLQTVQSLLDETIRKLNAISNSSVSIMGKGFTLYASYNNSDFYIEALEPDGLIISTKTYTAIFSNVSDMPILHKKISRQISKRASVIELNKLLSDGSSFNYKDLIIHNHFDDEFNF